MRRKKVTKELLSQLINARTQGKTYDQIQREFGVSKWTCIHYLRDIEIKGEYETDRRKVEIEAKKFLEEKGFTNMLDLNLICNSPYWDYYAEKNGKRWLIDVTIDKRKSIVGKVRRMINGFECAILYKNGEWNLIKIDLNEI